MKEGIPGRWSTGLVALSLAEADIRDRAIILDSTHITGFSEDSGSASIRISAILISNSTAMLPSIQRRLTPCLQVVGRYSIDPRAIDAIGGEEHQRCIAHLEPG